MENKKVVLKVTLEVEEGVCKISNEALEGKEVMHTGDLAIIASHLVSTILANDDETTLEEVMEEVVYYVTNWPVAHE